MVTEYDFWFKDQTIDSRWIKNFCSKSMKKRSPQTSRYWVTFMGDEGKGKIIVVLASIYEGYKAKNFIIFGKSIKKASKSQQFAKKMMPKNDSLYGFSK